VTLSGMDTATPTTAPAVTIPATGEYRIDPARTTVAFATRHLFGLAPVRGTFRLRGGHIRVAEPLGESAARATLDATSFHTGTAARDEQVTSATYLDAARHPDIVFASTGLRRDGDGWVLTGTLTVRGVTRPVPLRVRELSTVGNAAGGVLRVRAAARIDRHEFGITAGRGITGRRLTLSLDVFAAR
jgi:polyisoprenoid-binding protein YceI